MLSTEMLNRSFKLAMTLGDQAWAEGLIRQGADLGACVDAALGSNHPEAGLLALERCSVEWRSEHYLRPAPVSRRAAGPWACDHDLAPEASLEFLMSRGVAPPRLAVELAAAAPLDPSLFARMCRANPCQSPRALAAACKASGVESVRALLSLGWSAEAEFGGRSMLEWCLSSPAHSAQSLDACSLAILSAVEAPRARAPAPPRSDAPFSTLAPDEAGLARHIIALKLPHSAGALLALWRGSPPQSPAARAFKALMGQRKAFAPFIERERLLQHTAPAQPGTPRRARL